MHHHQANVPYPTPDYWPPEVPAGVGSELAAVRNSCANQCKQGLEAFQEFTPFGLGLKPDGHVTVAGGPYLIPDAVSDPVLYVYESLGATVDRLNALAIVESTGSDQSPFLRIYCEHRDGYAFRVSVPWQRQVDDNVRLLPPLVESTTGGMWR